MNVIKYGCEPKVTICQNCKSEIEYLDRELKMRTEIFYSYDKPTVEMTCIGFDCPVCGCWVGGVKQTSINILKNPPKII